MRKFYDLHLQLPLSDFESAERMIKKASWLGYSGIGVSLPHNAPDAIVSRIRQLCIDFGIDMVTRIDLTPKSADDLLSQLRRQRRRFEVIAVSCLYKTVARQAAKDRRVDLLSFPAVNFRDRYFDKSEAELAANSLSSYEIDASRLLSGSSFERVQLLTNLRRETAIAAQFSVPVIISSGAKTEYLMHKPWDFAALAYLFDLPFNAAVAAVSGNPWTIVSRNRMKLLPTFVAPGIRIVKKGKDC